MIAPEKQISAQPDGFGLGEEGELVTLANVKAFLNINTSAHDTRLAAMIASVNLGAFKETAGRLLKRPGASWEYWLTGIGSRILCLPQYPIGVVTTLEEGYPLDASTWQATRTVPASEYYVDENAGVIHGINRAWGHQRHGVRVVFTGGPVAVPADVVEALYVWCGVKWERLKAGRWDRKSEGFQAESKSFYERDIPRDVRITLREYRRPEVGSFG